MTHHLLPGLAAASFSKGRQFYTCTVNPSTIIDIKSPIHQNDISWEAGSLWPDMKCLPHIHCILIRHPVLTLQGCNLHSFSVGWKKREYRRVLSIYMYNPRHSSSFPSSRGYMSMQFATQNGDRKYTSTSLFTTPNA